MLESSLALESSPICAVSNQAVYVTDQDIDVPSHMCTSLRPHSKAVSKRLAQPSCHWDFF